MTDPAAHTINNVIRNRRIGFILASALLIAGSLPADSPTDPPPDLIRRVIQRETATQQAESRYTYQQSVSLEEFDSRGIKTGEYREKRDILFNAAGERNGEFIGKPRSSLVRLKMTEEDFRDLREVQPFQLTKEQAFIYETKFRGEETLGGKECWVIQVSPRQILARQRLFDGLIWVLKTDASIVQSEGRAVPEILTTRSENLFPRFTTVREQVDGNFWFPVTTVGDDTLQFRTGPQRMRLTIRYENYKKFQTDSTIRYDK